MKILWNLGNYLLNIFWESNVSVRFHTKADYERSIFDIDDHHHILDDYNSDSDEDHDNEYSDIIEPKEDFSLRIFYCSRTHSQLAQFVKEIQKTEFASDIRLVSLASRSNMCINDSVLSLKNNSMINERCLELQKKKPKLVLGEYYLLYHQHILVCILFRMSTMKPK